MEIRKAEKKKSKIKMALQGSAGSGKTYSSLLIAFGLCNDWSKIVVIDTENCSSDLYSDLGSYSVIGISPPYSPERYIEAIDLCERAGVEVIIIDSISHCWDYLIDVHANMQGNSFTNWAKITPRQSAFVNKILQSRNHILATMRVKQDYVLNQKDGKYIPEKVGLKAVQRDGVDYEFTIVLDINNKHLATASKDRTGIFDKLSEMIITKDTGRKIFNWCNSGRDDVNNIKELIARCTNNEQLKALFNKTLNPTQQITDAFTARKNQLSAINQSSNNITFKFNPNGTITQQPR